MDPRRAAAVPLYLAEGMSCALLAHWWVRGRRLARLMEPPRTESGPQEPGESLRFARRASAVALRLLARIPASPWRDTCLYRSAALCLLRRRRGLAGRLMLGARPAEGSDAGIEAHAWVAVGRGEENGASGQCSSQASDQLRVFRPCGERPEPWVAP